MTSVATQSLPIPESPYPGIEPFRFMDQQIFAARDDEIWDLQSSITIHRAVLVYGDSGTGKSSLINAGLVPKILDEDYVPDRLRVQPRAGKEIKVERIRTSAGGEAPFLPSNFAKDETSASFEISIEALMSRLMEFKNTAPQRRAFERSPILLFDQFEEFITLFEEAQRGEHQQALEAAECQRKILDSLVTLIKDEDLPIKILFVFREDYLAKLNVLFEHCPNLLDQYLRLLPPHVDRLKRIIRAPFEKEELRGRFVNVQPDEGRSELTEELAGEIAAELAKRSEGGRVNLSELQIVCRKLWESTDPVSLFKEEGIQGLLEQYMSAAVNKFPEDLRDPAVALLGHMVTSSNTRNIISQDDLINREKDTFSRERIERTLKALIESKLVLREPRRNVYFYEIVSEFLVPWIKQQQAARQAFLERRKLEEEAAEKLELANRQKRKLFYTSLVIVLFLFLGLVALVLWRQLKAAQYDSLVNEIKAASAQRTNLILTRLTEGTTQEKLTALDDAASLLEEGKVPRQLAVAILSMAASDSDPTVAAKATDLIAHLIKDNSESSDILAQSLGDAAENDVHLADKLPPRFYTHLANVDQTARADKLRDALEEKDYVVASYEVVGDNAPSTNQLRYFHQDSAGEAKEIVNLLQSLDQNPWTAVYIKGYENSVKIRAHHFEIWLGKEKPNFGTLLLSFVDEKGQEIPKLDFTVILKDKVSGRKIEKRSGYLEVAPGVYTIHVEAKEYKPLDDNMEITVTAGETVNLLNFPLRKKYAEPQ